MTPGWGRAGAALVVMLWSQAAWAERLGIHDMAESSRYRTKVVGMLGRGLLNVTTGYVDVFARVIEEPMEAIDEAAGLLPPKFGMTVGFFEGVGRGIVFGVGCGVLRTASGLVDWTTFWVPGFHGAPVSDSYHECLTYPKAKL